MKITTTIIKCDNCQGILFYEEDGKKQSFCDTGFLVTLTRGEKTISAIICSIPCFIMGVWYKMQGVTRIDIDLVNDLRKAYPLWKFESPNYKEIHEQKSIEEIKGRIKYHGLSNKKMIESLEV